jgi:hypothetical protein
MVRLCASREQASLPSVSTRALRRLPIAQLSGTRFVLATRLPSTVWRFRQSRRSPALSCEYVLGLGERRRGSITPQREYRQNSSIKVVLLGADQGPHFNDFGASEALIVRAPCRPSATKRAPDQDTARRIPSVRATRSQELTGNVYPNPNLGRVEGRPEGIVFVNLANRNAVIELRREVRYRMARQRPHNV